MQFPELESPQVKQCHAKGRIRLLGPHKTPALTLGLLQRTESFLPVLYYQEDNKK